jgi:hypothetical protein
MAVCDQCGNDYDKSFTIELGGRRSTFDSFECAIERLAPRCAHCKCRIIGHGVEEDGAIYCCDHCGSQMGSETVTDRT